MNHTAEFLREDLGYVEAQSDSFLVYMITIDLGKLSKQFLLVFVRDADASVVNLKLDSWLTDLLVNYLFLPPDLLPFDHGLLDENDSSDGDLDLSFQSKLDRVSEQVDQNLL